jgi:hypothetical protein
MQAARVLQEAFNLRSTVAVLGFSLRTLAQLLEEGKLDEVVAQQRAQGGGRPPAPRGERSERRGDRDRPAGAGGRTAARVDPFARPSRPAPAPSEEPIEEVVSEPAAAAEESADVATADATEADAPELAAVIPAEAEPTTAEAGTAEATPES